jgi:hypothetical protein
MEERLSKIKQRMVCNTREISRSLRERSRNKSKTDSIRTRPNCRKSRLYISCLVLYIYIQHSAWVDISITPILIFQ